MRDALVILAKGFCMGAADVVPGVSGGTMALVLGIYQRLLRSIRMVFDIAWPRLLARRAFREAAVHVDLALLMPLGIGIVLALAFFTRVVSLPGLIRTHPEPVYALFFGLIVGSMLVLARVLARPRWHELGAMVAGVAFGFAVVNVVPFETPTDGWFMFLAGALAICAMILPGISGAFVLLVLRKYEHVFAAIGGLDFGVLLPFALGAACGLALFSRLLVWLLERFYRHTIAAITGLLGGSLWLVWPFQLRAYELVAGKQRLVHSAPIWPQALDDTVALAAVLALVGLAGVLALEWAARQRAPAGAA